MIPVSTALSDPEWYCPPLEREWYVDKRGIICGLRYEPLIVQRYGTKACMGLRQQCPFYTEGYQCECMQEYEQLLFSLVDKFKTLEAFRTCAYKMANKFCFEKEPIIVLMVHEAPSNPCSEREALQLFFECKELEYPIK